VEAGDESLLIQVFSVAVGDAHRYFAATLPSRDGRRYSDTLQSRTEIDGHTYHSRCVSCSGRENNAGLHSDETLPEAETTNSEVPQVYLSDGLYRREFLFIGATKLQLKL
jgi:hypothetical protein